VSLKAQLKNTQLSGLRSITSKTTLLSNPDQWLKDFFFGGDYSGTPVNKQSVLALSALYACWKIRSETFASFPFQFLKVNKDGSEELATDHYLYNLVHSEPNAKQSSFFYRQTKMIHFDSDGNAYARIKRNQITGRPESLNIILPDMVRPLETDERLWYKIDGEDRPVNSNDILHIANFSMDGCKGVDPISAQRVNLGLSLNAQSYGNNYFENGTHADGVLETDQTPGPGKREEATNKVLEEWNKRYTGISKVGTTPVLWGGMKYRRSGASPAEAMLLETRSMSVPEIARVYRVPEEMLVSNKATATKHEQLMLQLQLSMLPLVKLWEEEYNRKLIPPQDKGKFVFRLNMDGLMRADTEAQAAIIETMFKTQSISPDEIRKLRGFGPRADGRGGEYGLPLASNIKLDSNKPTE
jgi:HK97 family phage portal protein